MTDSRLVPQPDVAGGGLPLYFEQGVQLGYRIWRVEIHNGAPRLCSLAKPTTWLPCEEFRASCWRTDTHLISEHRSPWADGDCECGVWAFRLPRGPRLALWMYGSTHSFLQEPTVAWAVGLVRLWGRVVDCELGFLAELAYPHEIELLDPHYVYHAARDEPIPARHGLLCQLGAEISRDYRIPVRVADPGHEPKPTLLERKSIQLAKSKPVQASAWLLMLPPPRYRPILRSLTDALGLTLAIILSLHGVVFALAAAVFFGLRVARDLLA